MSRRSLISVLVVAILVVVLAGRRTSASGSGIPPGISADAWRPIGESMGIAIRHEIDPRGKPGIFGTLMVKEAGRWEPVRLAEGPAGLVPAR